MVAVVDALRVAEAVHVEEEGVAGMIVVPALTPDHHRLVDRSGRVAPRNAELLRICYGL